MARAHMEQVINRSGKLDFEVNIPTMALWETCEILSLNSFKFVKALFGISIPKQLRKPTKKNTVS